MPHKLGWPYWAVHVWSSYGLDDFQIKLRITDGPLGANKLSAPLRTRHKSCTGVPRFCSEVSFYKDFQIKQFTRPADYRGLTSPSIPVSGAGRDAIKNAHNQNNPHFFLREKGTRFFARAGKKGHSRYFRSLENSNWNVWTSNCTNPDQLKQTKGSEQDLRLKFLCNVPALRRNVSHYYRDQSSHWIIFKSVTS